MTFRRLALFALPVFIGVFGVIARSKPVAQTYDAKSLAGAMRWRSIGPFRGGRTKAITGVPGQPNVFYMAPVNGGVCSLPAPNAKPTFRSTMASTGSRCG